MTFCLEQRVEAFLLAFKRRVIFIRVLLYRVSEEPKKKKMYYNFGVRYCFNVAVYVREPRHRVPVAFFGVSLFFLIRLCSAMQRTDVRNKKICVRILGQISKYLSEKKKKTTRKNSHDLRKNRVFAELPYDCITARRVSSFGTSMGAQPRDIETTSCPL